MSTTGQFDASPPPAIVQKPDAGVLNEDHITGSDAETDDGLCEMYKCKWGQLDNWRCERCGGFSTLKEDVAGQQQTACGRKQPTDQGDS